MPVNNSENGFWNKEISNSKPMNSPKFSPYNSRESSPPYPSSPISPISPLSTSPPLRRAFSSSFSFIPEDRAVDQPIIMPQNFPRRSTTEARFIRLIFWWPLFIVGFLQIIYQYLKSNFRQALMLLSPRFWFSAMWMMCHKVLRLPVVMLNEALSRLHSDSAERNRRKRTVLISGGSSIQTLHLARNFYSSGSRVVVCDHEGLFPLSKFSTTISKYYTVPNPSSSSVNDYITAICEIVIAENVTFYVPTCVSTASYFDALVKPHLELLGCQSFISGIHELSVLDDILETFERCKMNDIPVPNYKSVESKEELLALYDNGWMTGFRNVIMSVGHLGRVERKKSELPRNKRDLKFNHEISDKRPWVVLRDDLASEHYITCTTVKDSKVLANVTCLVQSDTKNLIPENNEAIEEWLREFFNTIRFQRQINGHFTFRLIRSGDNIILPVGIRVGVSLPYLCHTSVHTKLLWKSCPHFSRSNSGALVQANGRYWIHDMFLRTLRHPSVESLTTLIGTVLDKREVLFLYWDPLPYCAYYHYQLPLLSIREFLKKRRNNRI